MPRVSRREAGRQAALVEDYRTDLEVALAVASFRDDPPDSDYQRGFLDGLRERFVAMQATRG